MRVQPHQLTGLVVDSDCPAAGTDGRSRGIEQERAAAPSRRPVLGRRLPQRTDLCVRVLVVVVEVRLARDKLGVADGVGRRHEHPRVDILPRGLHVKDVAVELLIRLPDLHQRHVDREERRGDLELHQRAELPQFVQLLLHLDLPLLLPVGKAAVGAVKVVSLVDRKHELDGLRLVPYADPARLVDEVPRLFCVASMDQVVQ